MGSPSSLNKLSTTPVFNTKAVARETEVPADTFRAWERRYKVPQPQRTTGGHRLYSERDIAIIRWLRDRTAEGMNISQAVMLLNQSLDEEVNETLPKYVTPSKEPRGLGSLVDDFTNALISFDGARADQILSETFAMHPFEDVLIQMVQTAMVDIGERWHHGEINVAVEHYSTQFVRRKLSSLLNMFDTDEPRAKVLVACAPDELHDLGTLIISLFLARRGWKVIYLGPQMPLPDLIEAVRVLRPDLVCLSASMPETAAQLAEVAQALQGSFPHLPVGYGGWVFNSIPELRETMPGIFLGQNARELGDAVTDLLGRNPTSTIES
ncbi:MAG: cobalamin-dependent protein [Chloroflexota bacterium]